MQCVILAGGLGTRLGALAAEVPKHLVPVAGEPFADHQLSWLAGEGVERVVYCIGHHGDQIRAFVGDGSRWGITTRFVDEGERLRGTAGALRLALDEGALDDSFFVLYGDSWLSVDLRSVRAAHAVSGCEALMVIYENHDVYDRSNVLYRDGAIERYDKQPADAIREQMAYIDYGVSVLTRQTIARRVPSEEVVDLAAVLRDISLEGGLAGYVAYHRFYEIGTPQSVEELDAHLRSKTTPP